MLDLPAKSQGARKLRPRGDSRLIGWEELVLSTQPGSGKGQAGPLLPWALGVAGGLEIRVETAMKGQSQEGPGGGQAG